MGDRGSEEELIPTVEQEPLSEMDGTRENQVPSVVSLPSREALAILPLPNEEGTETLPLPSPSLDQEEMLSTPGQEIPPTRQYPQKIRKPPLRYWQLGCDVDNLMWRNVVCEMPCSAHALYR